MNPPTQPTPTPESDTPQYPPLQYDLITITGCACALRRYVDIHQCKTTRGPGCAWELGCGLKLKKSGRQRARGVKTRYCAECLDAGCDALEKELSDITAAAVEEWKANPHGGSVDLRGLEDEEVDEEEDVLMMGGEEDGSNKDPDPDSSMVLSSADSEEGPELEEKDSEQGLTQAQLEAKDKQQEWRDYLCRRAMAEILGLDVDPALVEMET